MKSPRRDLTQDCVRALFDYAEGWLVWRKWQKRAGGRQASGYYHVGIDGHQYQLHRVVFLWHHGHLPKTLDHIDGNPSNNSIENLRPATHKQNMANRRKSLHPKSSRWKGVNKHRSGLWQVQVIGIYLGMFDEECDAAMLYNEAALEWFGDFASLNDAEQEVADAAA